MNVQESYDKNTCDECGEYTYVFEIKTGDEEWARLRLCKKCLLQLLKAIVER